MRRLVTVVAAVALLAAPAVLSASWQLSFSLGGAFAIAALGLVVVTGWSGQINLAQAAFMGLGGILIGRLTGVPGVVFNVNRQGGSGLGDQLSGASNKPLWVWGDAPLWLGLLIVVVVAVALSVLVGVPALRARGLHLAIATLAFALIIEYMVLRYTRLGGGYEGFVLNTSMTGTQRYYLVWLMALAFGVLVHRLRRTKLGMGLLCLKGSELAAEGLGMSGLRYKLLAFAFAGGLGALGGAMYGVVLGAYNWQSFNSFVSVLLVAAASVGGIETVGGAMLGGLIYACAPQALREFDVDPFAVPVVFAVALALTVIVRPKGIVSPAIRRRRAPAKPERVGAEIDLPSMEGARA